MTPITAKRLAVASSLCALALAFGVYQYNDYAERKRIEHAIAVKLAECDIDGKKRDGAPDTDRWTACAHVKLESLLNDGFTVGQLKSILVQNGKPVNIDTFE